MLCRKRPVKTEEYKNVRHVADTFHFEDLDLAHAVCTLPPQLKEAFLLVKGEGFTHAEAARAAHVPVGTMYFRGARGGKAVAQQADSPSNL